MWSSLRAEGCRRGSTPHLNTLVEISQETINVTILDGNECVNVERVASPKPIRYVGWIGRRTPLHCTASGKVFLAHMTAEERSGCLQFPLARYTEKTVTEAPRLEQSLAQICARGYAAVHEEFEDGFSAIAAPVFNHNSQVIATITISGPTYRLSIAEIEAFVEPLQQVAQTISAEMGYTGPYQK